MLYWSIQRVFTDKIKTVHEAHLIKESKRIQLFFNVFFSNK